MKKNYVISVMAGCMLLFAACKQSADKPATVAEESTIEKTEGAPATTRYSIKSAKVTTSMELPGGMGTSTSILYFDDYGKKEMRETVSGFSMGGKSMNTTSRTIIQTDYIYTWVVGQKTGTKIKMGGKFDPSTINYKELTEEWKNKFKMKDEGTATVLGRTCKVISYEAEGMKGKSYVWENIPMKAEMSMSGKTIVSEVTDFQENVSIPASEFEIPADVEFKEIKMPKMNS